jgi:hypothetical protein
MCQDTMSLHVSMFETLGDDLQMRVLLLHPINKPLLHLHCTYTTLV